uniref:ATP synthase complex subunit 8 n=1 Tax=Pyrearinus termitilluminans TaxID=109589 RepID=A0A158V180_9COLE|nr:ATP synthase F0 subunit 8 [Pyrearinus termitilluminans]AIQ80125.1 ATP synthase F0 subunit 8 [Pyrearinus termitilluminans]
MPQMAPMSWLSLFTSFVMMFLIMSSLNYFSFNYSNTQTPTSKKLHTFNWKW